MSNINGINIENKAEATEDKKAYIRNFFKGYFDLGKDKDIESETIERIKKGVDFKGVNTWILILAIFVASLGLNVNSTAVIIGAMLISPLMGPIIGMGLSVGINDFELMKRSFKSYLVTTLFSVTTATIYFTLTPIAEAQSELLSRTSPNIYDVFIALFGGLAGIVALSTKEKGNVIPGVAIATALMPPLCTAGYGIASGQFNFFLGAFYLYFINSLFISVATFIGVRVMHFKPKNFVDKAREKRVSQYIVIAVILTMCPAIYLTVGIVRSAFYESSANRFINKELTFDKTFILDKQINYEKNEIKITFVGEDISEEVINIATAKLPDYRLKGTKLNIIQGMNGGDVDVASIKSMLMEDLYKNSEKKIAEQQNTINQLEKDINNYRVLEQIKSNIVPEMKALYPNVKSVSIANTIELNIASQKSDTITIAFLKMSSHLPEKDVETMKKWLSARVGAKKMHLVTEVTN